MLYISCQGSLTKQFLYGKKTVEKEEKNERSFEKNPRYGKVGSSYCSGYIFDFDDTHHNI